MAGFRNRTKRDYPTDISKETLPQQISKSGALVKEKLMLSKIAQLPPDEAVVVLGAWQPSEKDELDVVDEYDKDTE
jgi:hypothetical protein